MNEHDTADYSPDPGSAETAGTETSGTETAGTETAGTYSGSANETQANSETAEEAGRNSMVETVGNPNGGLEPPKKRRGRPPGSRNKAPGVAAAKKNASVGSTPEEAEQSARISLKLITPAYNGGFTLLGKPVLQPEEIKDIHDALYEISIKYGDPLGKYGVWVLVAAAFTQPIVMRVMPPEWGGMNPDGSVGVKKVE